MKPGTRALGLAESYTGTAGEATLAGAVEAADRTVESFSFAAHTIGGTDVTDAAIAVWNDLDRPDVAYVLTAGVALAWYNIIDLERLHDATGRPVIAVSFEDSPGLEPALREAFDGDALAERLAAYRALPERRPVTVDGDALYVRTVDCDDPERVLAAYHGDGRPHPLRVAGAAARAADDYRRHSAT